MPDRHHTKFQNPAEGRLTSFVYFCPFDINLRRVGHEGPHADRLAADELLLDFLVNPICQEARRRERGAEAEEGRVCGFMISGIKSSSSTSRGKRGAPQTAARTGTPPTIRSKRGSREKDKVGTSPRRCPIRYIVFLLFTTHLINLTCANTLLEFGKHYLLFSKGNLMNRRMPKPWGELSFSPFMKFDGV